MFCYSVYSSSTVLDTPLPLEPPHFGGVSTLLWKHFLGVGTYRYYCIPQCLDWVASHPEFEYPFPPYLKGVLLNEDQVNVDTTLTQKTHCCAPRTNLPTLLM